MSQGADDSRSQRFSNPAHVYGPMVYQFPPEQFGGGEKGRSKSNSGVNYLVLALIVGLAIGGMILYLKENGVDIRDLGWRTTFGSSPFFGRSVDRTVGRPSDMWQWQRPSAEVRRVAVESLYMREGPGPDYEAIYLLPEDWKVSLLGEIQTDYSGEPWARIRVQTNQGPQVGWVSQRYLDF